MRPLIIDSFAGGGGASTGIEMALGRSPDYAINHDPDALAMHEMNHPETEHLSNNVWKVNPDDVAKARPVGLAWFSPDCFPAGTMVLTDQGYRPIETIMEGDRVLTHRGRYRRVYATMKTRKVVRGIDIQGVPTIAASEEHPFFARPMHNVWDNEHRRYERTLLLPSWIPAKDLRVGSSSMNAAGGDRHFCATPCRFEPLPIPKVGGRGIEIDERLMWLAGRYVGDGWSRIERARAELVITCGKDEADGLKTKLDSWPRTGRRAAFNQLTWHHRETATAFQFSTNHRGLVEWLRTEFGHGAAAKSFPAWCLSAPEHLRRALLAGYVSADGSEIDTGANMVNETVTISKALALSTKSLVESLGLTATVSQPRQNSSVIEGRSVDASPAYMVRWRENPLRVQTVRDELHNWSRVQSVGLPRVLTEVFNISVEEDETYIADGIVVHNCKHFSKAKGGRPVQRNIRDLAWVVVLWAQRARPDVIILENVEEFITWGPIGPDDKPCKKRAGETFTEWSRALRKAGYKLQFRMLRACDYGAPTIRKRLFVIARRDGKPIVWPEPTHGKPDDPAVIAGRKQPWRTAAEIIDWTLPCPSIFDTSEEIKAKYGIRAIRPLADATMRRIARGVVRYVLEAAKPFVISVAHGYSGGRREYPIDDPLGTQTSTGNAHAVVVPTVVGCGGRAGQSAPRGGDQPLGTLTAKADSCLAAVHMSRFTQNGIGHGVDEPVDTVMAGAPKFGVVAAFLAQHNTARGDGVHPGRPADAPVSTLTVGGSQQQLVAAHLTKFQTGSTGSAMVEPAPTITANSYVKRPGGAAPIGVVAAHISQLHGSNKTASGGAITAPLGTVTIGGENFVITDIGMRMLTPRERFRAQGFPDSYIIDRRPDGSPISQTVQGSCCGNSVCPPLAAAIVAANCADLASQREAAE